MKNRIANPSLHARIASVEEAGGVIQNRMTLAFGGYTACGYPKVMARELARRARGGEELRLNLVTSSHIGSEIYDELLGGGVLARCAPLIEGRDIGKAINAGQVHYVEQQMCRMPRLIRASAFGHIDVAVVEAIAITADGGIVPSNGIGMAASLIAAADKVIVELNTAQPEELRGLHDIHVPAAPPATRPIPLTRVGERIGGAAIPVDPAKIAAIVASDMPECRDYTPPGTALKAVTDNLLNFLEQEAGRNWRGWTPPFQTGFGNLTNAIAIALGESKFRDIEFFCGGVAEEHVRLMERDKLRGISTGSLMFTPYVLETLRSRPELFREKLILRNGEIANAAETVGRLGVVALNTGIEIDIYGNVNSSHIAGNRLVNGIGGGAGFAENALLSVAMIPSIAKKGDISAIVPMVSHHDIIEHDVDVVITENGVADLRGRDDIERARAIIGSCAHPEYRDALTAYLDQAMAEGGGHHPVSLSAALSWHERLRRGGSMRP